MALGTDDEILHRVLEGASLGHRVTELASYAAREVELAPSDVPSGSRLGGPPVLPAEHAWPAHRWSHAEVATWPDYARDELGLARANGWVVDEKDHVAMPLLFVGVLDTSALHAAAPQLPRDGALHLFASVGTMLPDESLPGRIAAAVIHAPIGPERTHPPQPEPPLQGVQTLVA